MELLLKHRKAIQAADLGRVWQDDTTGAIYISREGNRNLGWSRTAITTEAGELIEAGYLRRVEGSTTVEPTKDGRDALDAARPMRFPVVVARVA